MDYLDFNTVSDTDLFANIYAKFSDKNDPTKTLILDEPSAYSYVDIAARVEPNGDVVFRDESDTEGTIEDYVSLESFIKGTLSNIPGVDVFREDGARVFVVVPRKYVTTVKDVKLLLPTLATVFNTVCDNTSER